MTMARRTRNAAPANSPTPVPPALTLTFSSDLASWISLLIKAEMSRVASLTRRPMVGSESLTGWVAMLVLPAPVLCAPRRGPRPTLPSVVAESESADGDRRMLAQQAEIGGDRRRSVETG